jgi:hypothetical protein
VGAALHSKVTVSVLRGFSSGGDGSRPSCSAWAPGGCSWRSRWQSQRSWR